MAVAALPELGYVGSGISNDNLAFPAFAVFFTGVIRYDEDKPDFRTYALIGTSFLLGSFSKLTAAMIMLIMLITILVNQVSFSPTSAELAPAEVDSGMDGWGPGLGSQAQSGHPSELSRQQTLLLQGGFSS